VRAPSNHAQQREHERACHAANDDHRARSLSMPHRLRVKIVRAFGGADE
jgi:hypothetical protein